MLLLSTQHNLEVWFCNGLIFLLPLFIPSWWNTITLCMHFKGSKYSMRIVHDALLAELQWLVEIAACSRRFLIWVSALLKSTKRKQMLFSQPRLQLIMAPPDTSLVAWWHQFRGVTEAVMPPEWALHSIYKCKWLLPISSPFHVPFYSPFPKTLPPSPILPTFWPYGQLPSFDMSNRLWQWGCLLQQCSKNGHPQFAVCPSTGVVKKIDVIKPFVCYLNPLGYHFWFV